ncbi:MAG: Mut7-C RNAse domain-containing protein [Candidatus Kryptonium sp.]|nr:Mut7-C RNAse domain-containing protein [Candidatus Kryptonium sp.]MCX7763031.1 Mut7-C RNAse domain-containing protein [Candidatus Kryptonium sp.]MDW8109958.1 Mut7-C RNAse domain-containing protein [Candidatus Kryptonium sp.]
MKFVADVMLGKLARWLRLIGYDTIYDPNLSAKELVKIANEEGRIFITRSRRIAEELGAKNFYIVKSERFKEQLTEIVRELNLDTETNLFSRCSICNTEIVEVEKSSVMNLIPEETAKSFDEFYQCPKCGKIYWDGSHTTRILKLLKEIKNE